jgi:hypothetical protein
MSRRAVHPREHHIPRKLGEAIDEHLAGPSAFGEATMVSKRGRRALALFLVKLLFEQRK